MSALGTTVVIAGILVGLAVVTVVLSLIAKRGERPVRENLRVVVRSQGWWLAGPAWFGGVSGVVLAAQRPDAPVGMWVVSIVVLAAGCLVAGFQVAVWWQPRRWPRQRERALREFVEQEPPTQQE